MLDTAVMVFTESKTEETDEPDEPSTPESSVIILPPMSIDEEIAAVKKLLFDAPFEKSKWVSAPNTREMEIRCKLILDGYIKGKSQLVRNRVEFLRKEKLDCPEVIRLNSFDAFFGAVIHHHRQRLNLNYAFWRVVPKRCYYARLTDGSKEKYLANLKDTVKWTKWLGSM